MQDEMKITKRYQTTISKREREEMTYINISTLMHYIKILLHILIILYYYHMCFMLQTTKIRHQLF